MGSFEFHRFSKRGPIQMVSIERNGVGVECSGDEHKAKGLTSSIRISMSQLRNTMTSPWLTFNWLHVRRGDKQAHALYKGVKTWVYVRLLAKCLLLSNSSVDVIFLLLSENSIKSYSSFLIKFPLRLSLPIIPPLPLPSSSYFKPTNFNHNYLHMCRTIC